VLEGPDGSGQSTQANLLTVHLERKGYSVVLTKEPTSESEAGRMVRNILTQGKAIDPLELQKLFTADRKKHLEKLIIPSLQLGKIVISDRYFFSTFAYGSLDCDIEQLIKLNQDFVLPDFTFILVVRPEICLERILRRSNEIQYFEKQETLRKVLEVYKTFPVRFQNTYLIDGEKEVNQVAREIAGKVEKMLKDIS
jgi:dTMP kinase